VSNKQIEIFFGVLKLFLTSCLLIMTILLAVRGTTAAHSTLIYTVFSIVLVIILCIQAKTFRDRLRDIEW
jgi:uncharacterized membrane protein